MTQTSPDSASVVERTRHHQANAAIGVSWQILLVVIAFISSLFTGMSVLVARFAGAVDGQNENAAAVLQAIGNEGNRVCIRRPAGFAVAVAGPRQTARIGATDI